MKGKTLQAAVALLFVLGGPSSGAAQEPGAIAFPGQYAPPNPGSRYPVWPSGCSRFPGEEKAACLAYVAFDYGRLSRFAAANAALAAPREDETRVVLFGDSITDNWSNPGYGGFFPGKPYVNRGISGQTTSQMLVRFRADVIALKPRAVVILAGTNDVAENSGPVELAAIEGNLATMAELASRHRIRVVLASLLPVSDEKRDGANRALVQTAARPPETLRALNAWLAEYAKANGHVYLDYFSALADAKGVFKAAFTDDGLHPNAAGYGVMTPLAEQAIAQALAERP